ncbi:hypothetical protein CC86DRAFT_172212 [Ophiobolus disseminans]|uniref:Mid2 domain-containing protein n=1 Tax=Ophiobolus disseminans TaxID=1469910 RepID=A0A6A7A8U3_9PLEO|nr:hypothetical protein CC86DRAFT_172212 [Ophiobolus disseminans]
MTSAIVQSEPTISVFTTFDPSYTLSKLPRLVTRYTAPAECRERWVLPNPAEQTPIVFSTNPPPRANGDILYTSCMPQSHVGWFSPGVCPDAYTIASASVVQWSASGRLEQEWDALCCQSGMTFKEYACVSTFSTPLRAFVPFTPGISGTTTDVPSAVYQYLSYWNVGSLESTTTLTNITVLNTGVAQADPIYVAWRAKDLSLFPVSYATSVAQQFGIAFTPGPTPGGSLNLPQETGSLAAGLSTGAKAGIGVGAVLGFAILVGVAFLCLYIRLRRRRRAGGDDGLDKTSERDRS